MSKNDLVAELMLMSCRMSSLVDMRDMVNLALLDLTQVNALRAKLGEEIPKSERAYQAFLEKVRDLLANEVGIARTKTTELGFELMDSGDA